MELTVQLFGEIEMKVVYQAEDDKLFTSSEACEEHELFNEVRDALIASSYSTNYAAERQAEGLLRKFFITRRPVQMELPEAAPE